MLTKGLQFDRHGAEYLAPNAGAQLRRAIYFYRVRHDNCITEFCVANWQGPQSVWSYQADYTPAAHRDRIDSLYGADASERRREDIMIPWDSYEEGDLLVF